jgi:hypothetical protein
MGQIRSDFENSRGRDHFGDLGIRGRAIFKIYPKETWSMSVDWGQPALCMEQCLICEESNKHLGAEKHAEKLLNSQVC